MSRKQKEASIDIQREIQVPCNVFTELLGNPEQEEQERLRQNQSHVCFAKFVQLLGEEERTQSMIKHTAGVF